MAAGVLGVLTHSVGTWVDSLISWARIADAIVNKVAKAATIVLGLVISINPSQVSAAANE